MALKFFQKRPQTRFLHGKTSPQRLGEILHFIVEALLVKAKWEPKDEELRLLTERALALYPEPLLERKRLEEEALRIISQALQSRAWQELRTLLKDSREVYPEIEGYFKRAGQSLRPDLLLFTPEKIFLIEIKLRKEDYRPEQTLLYSQFLKALYPQKKILLLLISLLPFEVFTYETPGLSHTTQLSLFEELN